MRRLPHPFFKHLWSWPSLPHPLALHPSSHGNPSPCHSPFPFTAPMVLSPPSLKIILPPPHQWSLSDFLDSPDTPN